MVDNTSLTGAALLIDALQANGLNNMYGVVGIPVTDFARLAELKGMKFYGFRREDSAVDAAAAAGFITGKPGVALTVSAPGFLNGLTALAQATKNCFPLIMISGSSDRHIIDLDRGDYEGLDQYNVAKPFCKAAYRVDRAEDMGLAVARAVRTAVSGRPGGVYLDLPAATVSDTVAQKSDANIYKVVDPAPKQLPSDEAINRAVELLNNAKHPVLLLGKGAAYAQAEDEIRELVAKTNIPFLPMSMAKGVVPDDSPASAASARSFTLGQADVVLLVGARLNWMLSNGGSPLFSPDAKFIQVDIDATEFDSNRKIDAPLQGDIKSVMQKFNSAVIDAGVKAPQDWLDQIKTESEKNNTKFAKRISASEAKPTLGFYSAIEPINDLLQKHPDTYIVSEGANTLDIGRNLISMQNLVTVLTLVLGVLWVSAWVTPSLQPLKLASQLSPLKVTQPLVLTVWKWKLSAVTTYLLLSLLLTTVVFTTVMLTLFLTNQAQPSWITTLTMVTLLRHLAVTVTV